ncbi:MAG: hypothetical protein HY367_03295 [Candidatus Aenigmarchaeota archaeon]|nr:hypothetical protein [Candidatus Aenigmarchaeota archaeon]
MKAVPALIFLALLLPPAAAAQEGIEISLLANPRTLARGDDFLVKVLLTQNSTRVLGASVSAESEIFSATLSDDGAHDDNAPNDGIYAGTVRIGSSVKRGGYGIAITASKGPDSGRLETSIFVDPELAVTLAADKEKYQTFDRIEVSGSTSKSSRPAPSNVTLSIICGQYARTIAQVETDSQGGYRYVHPISRAIPLGSCTIEAVAADTLGNSGSATRQVTIEFSEQEIYRLVFLDPIPGAKYKEGGDMKIRLKVQSGDRLIEGANVLCEDPFGELSISLDEFSGIYSGVYNIPLGKLPPGWSVSCVAQTEDGFFGKNLVNVNIESIDIDVSVISPAERSFTLGQAVEMLVEIGYSDGKPVVNGNVELSIANKTVELEETENPGIYAGRFTVEHAGLINMEVTASDNAGNSDTIRLTAVSKPGVADVVLYAAIMVAVAIGLVMVGTMWRRKKGRAEKKGTVPPRDRLKELEGERARLKKSMDVTEKEYYKRKIDERAFNKLMQDYEEELIQIDVEIKQLRELVAGEKGT